MNPVVFAPGTSPFRTKGTIWAGIQAFVDERVPGGIARVCRSLDSAHAEYLSQMFVAIGWYDLMPIGVIAEGIAEVMGVDRLDYVGQSAAFQAERDKAGVYKRLLSSSAPDAFCRRYASVYSQLYDFGRAQILNEGPQRCESTVYGFPEPIAWWWMRGSECYLQLVLRATGARNPVLSWTERKPDGERSRVPLLRISAVTTWT